MSSTSSRHLVIDCDPGCDDALALLLAFSSGVYHRIDILTVAGNVGIQQVTANARRICALAQAHRLLPADAHDRVKVYRGAAASLRGEKPSAASIHGRDGLGDVPLRALLPPGCESNGFLKLAHNFRTRDQTAVGFYLSPFDRELKPDLVCTGPVTNLALALLQRPREERADFWEQWKRVVIMGGAVKVPGNISYAAEFNAHADPDALAVVLESWREHKRSKELEATPLVLVPLDVTEQVALLTSADELPKSSLGRAVFCLLRKYFLFHAMNYDPIIDSAAKVWLDDSDQRKKAAETVMAEFRNSRLTGGSGLKKLPRWCFLHDPVALWVALNWDKFEEFMGSEYFRVERGRGEGRGHIYHAEPRRFFQSTGAETRGDLLKVQVLCRSAGKSLRTTEAAGFLASLEKMLVI